MKTIPFYTVCWAGMVILGIVNGIMRENLYGKRMRELYAHQLSTVTGILVFGIYIWLLTGIRPIESSQQALTIGIVWLSLTVLFEFGFGHFVIGHSWRKLLHDYNLARGRMWSLVLIFVTMAPYICYQIRP